MAWYTCSRFTLLVARCSFKKCFVRICISGMTRPQFQYLDSSKSLWGQDSYLIWNLFSVCVFACLLGVSHLWRLQQDEPRQNISRWERETRTRKLSNSIQQQAERLGRIVLFVCDWQAEIVLLWQQTAISHFFIFFFLDSNQITAEHLKNVIGG